MSEDDSTTGTVAAVTDTLNKAEPIVDQTEAAADERRTTMLNTIHLLESAIQPKVAGGLGLGAICRIYGKDENAVVVLAEPYTLLPEAGKGDIRKRAVYVTANGFLMSSPYTVGNTQGEDPKDVQSYAGGRNQLARYLELYQVSESVRHGQGTAVGALQAFFNGSGTTIVPAPQDVVVGALNASIMKQVDQRAPQIGVDRGNVLTANAVAAVVSQPK